MGNILITSGMYYQVELKDGIYYPALVDIAEFDNKRKAFIKTDEWVNIWFYLPNKNATKLSLKFKSLERKHFNHLDFPDINTEIPKIFIHKGLAELLEKGNPSEVSPFNIKSFLEVQDYKKYFNIFEEKIKEPLDNFSRFSDITLPTNK